ncbi:phosphotransferase [Henriciella sp. AS95]|uniref:phosphotransferase family protein n=1 Tax=Henriciella sp. AS95 TaxID=3135782 RepID=UPI00316BAC50
MFDASIKQIVKAHFPGETLDKAVRMQGGVSADVYKLQLSAEGAPARDLVLRIHGQTHGGHPAGLEFQLLQFAYDAGLPVQTPVLVDTSCTHLPAPYLIVSYVDGTTEISEGNLDETLGVMARVMFALHATSTKALPDLPERTDPIPDLIGFLPSTEENQAFRAWLEALKSAPYAGALVPLHGDFWPGNLVWQGDCLAAILDWEDAAIGDPLSDVACTCLELRYLFGGAVMQRFADAYRAHAPIDPERLTLWLAYVSAAALRYMGDWRLAPDREAHMRKEALATLKEARTALGTQSGMTLTVHLDGNQIGKDGVGADGSEIEIGHIGMANMDVFTEIIGQRFRVIISEHGS